MKLNYKKIILVLILIIIILNLSFSKALLWFINPEIDKDFGIFLFINISKSNIYPYSIYKLFYDISDYIVHYYHDPFTTFYMIVRYIYSFLASWTIFIWSPILSIIPKNFEYLFFVIWIIINSYFLFIILRKMNLLWKETGIKIILLIVSLMAIPFSPYGMAFLFLYLIYLIASWLSKLKPIK